MEISRSGYYDWVRERGNRAKNLSIYLTVKIKELHEKSRLTYCSRRISAELKDEGILIGKNKVAEIMYENGIRAKTKRKYKATKNSKHKLPIAVNLLEDSPKAEQANKIWVADITYKWTHEGWLYLSSILDIYSRKIVAWELSNRLTKNFVVTSISKAVKHRNPENGLIFYSDKGSQYASYEVKNILNAKGIRQSKRGKGNCYDNAIVESFFHTLKTELV